MSDSNFCWWWFGCFLLEATAVLMASMTWAPALRQLRCQDGAAHLSRHVPRSTRRGQCVVAHSAALVAARDRRVSARLRHGGAASDAHDRPHLSATASGHKIPHATRRRCAGLVSVQLRLRLLGAVQVQLC